ncbi:2,4-dienoyl-CoA reductase-like NADH-dependent reductase (Old Yellow Enzyme family) [Paenibacillus phyllosphaerae]|uniref:2,4-dienoyl-CoA reductase-like NADH-dependent reductase (Old Yellow Enzyme family) n=1 Tax=Paenibacillus phyllosphaerae TaxID=274593 RepID=A0A7W5AXQ5_9BACL|nr:NADH:flavin oxidoreductase/NADH oxidase [Paenibacillus phyllosphaerae]MBB3110700.1 2,4-dienoyl-CoA reductase-like NADH-dependent reductase (Old Yellow Enzyme family) [Paenibacillus phyllosphaerae]
MSYLDQPFTLGNMTVKNRIVMPPMCQYAVEAKDGIPNEWHYVHYLSRAVGGTGLIIIEMTDVEPDGRITDYDLGLWSDEHTPAFARIIEGVKQYGAKVGIQIAHAGRKAEDAEVPVGPSDIRVDEKFKTPRPLTIDEIQAMVGKFAAATRRAVAAGVDTIELHGAHGYLIHQFHSPAINNRDDIYGREPWRFGVEVIRAVKAEMPAGMPLIIRVSAIEYMEDGYELEHLLGVVQRYKEAGVDAIHVSSGGEGPVGSKRKPGNYPGYQVGFAREIKQATGLPVIAVGHLDDPKLAESVVASGDADLVAVGRAMLRDPYWAYNALRANGVTRKGILPKPYLRGE